MRYSRSPPAQCCVRRHKRGLLSGETLPVARMDAREQAAFLAVLLSSLSDDGVVDGWTFVLQSGYELPLEPTPAQLAGGGLRVVAEDSRSRDMQGQEQPPDGQVSSGPRYQVEFMYY